MNNLALYVFPDAEILLDFPSKFVALSANIGVSHEIK